MSDRLTEHDLPEQNPSARPAGPARDFAAFCELDRERRRNSDEDFDPGLFEEAVALVLGRLDPHSSDPRPVPSSPAGAAVDRP
jgi:hypothetical protein